MEDCIWNLLQNPSIVKVFDPQQFMDNKLITFLRVERYDF